MLSFVEGGENNIYQKKLFVAVIYGKFQGELKKKLEIGIECFITYMPLDPSRNAVEILIIRPGSPNFRSSSSRQRPRVVEI